MERRSQEGRTVRECSENQLSVSETLRSGERDRGGKWTGRERCPPGAVGAFGQRCVIPVGIELRLRNLRNRHRETSVPTRPFAPARNSRGRGVVVSVSELHRTTGGML